MKKLMHVLCGLLLTVLPLSAQELDNGTPQYTIELINGVPFVNINVGAYVDLTPYLNKDGSVAYTATQNGGGFGITNLGSLLPAGSNTVDLGSAVKPWRYSYLSDTGLFLGDYNVTKIKAQLWDIAYGWGNHAIAGYASTGSVDSVSNRVSGLEGQTNNWNTAYGWGNHAIAGYANTNNPTIFLQSVTVVGDLVTTPQLLTNSGTATLSATATQLVSITGMSGNMWSFRKPMLYSTNVPFSASADVSLFSSSTLSGDTEQWRANMAFASVYNTNAIVLATNRLYVADGTPFQSLVLPFQAIILDGTSNEVVTVTNVSSSTLILNYPTRYSHAVSNVVAHACTLNIPGFLNDDLGANTLRAYVQFQTPQTVGIQYSIPYLRMK